MVFVPLRVMSWKLPPPERPVDASYKLVWSLTSSSISGAGEMLSVIEPSFEVMLVASTPLKNRLVLVVRVPFTDGEMLPVPLTSTGGRSALTPASADSKCVKLRVEVGTSVSSSALIRRYTAAVLATTTGTSALTVTCSVMAPTSSVILSCRVTVASTSTSLLSSFLKPLSSNDTVYRPTGSEAIVHSPDPPLTAD